MFFKIFSLICCSGISKYGINFLNFFNFSNCLRVKISGYRYNILYIQSHSIFSSSANNSKSIALPYRSTPYLFVSWAIKIISSIPAFSMFCTSCTISSIGKDFCFHLIFGMMQKVHLLLHHSAIFKYSNLYLAFV